MIRKRFKKRRKTSTWITANHRIRFPQVRVLLESGEMLGVMSTSEAQSKADQEKKDLILITENAKPPVVKIIELSKYKYQLKRKQAKHRKNQRTQKTKEIRFKIFIEDADFQAKLNKIINFLKKNQKVKLSLEFRGRQIVKKDMGYELMGRIFSATSDLADIEQEPKIVGKKMFALIAPKGKSKNEQS